MKILKYLLFAIGVLFCACTSSPQENNDLDPVIKAERETLLAATQYGVYRDGKPLLVFDKTTHQLSANPTKHVYRILDNVGYKYMELRLDGTPSNDTPVNATQVNNMNLRLSIVGKVILLKSDSERLWLWSDSAHAGFIVPKGGI